jgi:copper resistance protein C
MNPCRLKFLGRGRAAGIMVTGFALATWPLADATAHALVIASTPSMNATVVGPDLDLDVQFSDRIDRKHSKLNVVSTAGQPYAVQPLDDESAGSLTGHVGGLLPGSYRLQWQVLAVDGHITRGEIPFTVTAP